jgi:hypothetical protein
MIQVRVLERIYDTFKCSSQSTICRTQAPKQQQSWWHSVSCGQAYRRIAAPGHELVKPANAPNSPATLLLHWEISHHQQPVFFTSTQTSLDFIQRQQAIHTASLQLTASHDVQKPFQFRTSQPKPWHAPS